jgi:hypothetical protein
MICRLLVCFDIAISRGGGNDDKKLNPSPSNILLVSICKRYVLSLYKFYQKF